MNKHKKLMKFGAGFLAFVMVFGQVSNFSNFTNFAFALSEDLIQRYDDYQIYFYNEEQEDWEEEGLPNPSPRKCTPGVESSGNQNYAGATVWSDAELAAIAENQAVYEAAASEYGFPWQVLAVLHSMETSLRRNNPANGQGLYQLYSYTGGGSNSNAFLPAGPVSEEEFLRQSKIAAGVAVGMAGDLNNPDNVKKLFFKYNGTASKYIEKARAMGFSDAQAQNGEGSVYVMNRYDAQRDPTSGEMSPHWPGRFVADGRYDPDSTTTVFGSYVKYEALDGVQYCDDGGAIVETAILLSWDGHGHSKDDPKPEYVEAMKQVGSYYKPCRSEGDCAPIGASCDVFVGTVMRYSGVDTGFPLTNPSAQKSYMESHSEMYSKVEVGDVSGLQAGDILVKVDDGRHIYIYIGDGAQASASYNDRTGEHYSGVTLSGYGVFRRISGE